MATLDRRFEVRMTPEMEKLLNELAAKTGMTRAEIFRRSIGLYKLAKGVENRQGKVLLQEPGENVRELVGI
jgi:predicted DNA-binding protein